MKDMCPRQPLRGVCDEISTRRRWRWSTREAAVRDPTTEDNRVSIITKEVSNAMAILNTDFDTNRDQYYCVGGNVECREEQRPASSFPS